MARPTPGAKSVIYDEIDIVSLPVGATALQYGDICKMSANLLVPAAADDKQLQFFVALAEANASGGTNAYPCPAVELSKCRLEIGYTAAPTVGDAFGIDDARTLDQSDTTNKLLTVISVDTSRATADCIAYRLTS